MKKLFLVTMALVLSLGCSALRRSEFYRGMQYYVVFFVEQEAKGDLRRDPADFWEDFFWRIRQSKELNPDQVESLIGYAKHLRTKKKLPPLPD